MKQYNKAIQKMINFDDVKKGDTKEHNRNQPPIADHSYRILIIGGFGSNNPST